MLTMLYTKLLKSYVFAAKEEGKKTSILNQALGGYLLRKLESCDWKIIIRI